LDVDESDTLLRRVLELAALDLDARTIGVRLGSHVGSDDIPAGTIRYWHKKAREMKANGLL
jgi:hypothetical protein